MAVRIERSLPNKFSSAVEKSDEITKTTLEHVKRILSDHDYLKNPFLDELSSNKNAIVQVGVQPHATQTNVESGNQNTSGPCIPRDQQMECKGESPDEGIQASDLSSLLDKFEQAINNPSTGTILTPATSPGRPENWSEPLSLKINSHVNSTDLTPPATPPIQEKSEQLLAPNECRLHEEERNEKLPVHKSTKHKDVQNKPRDLKFQKENLKKSETVPLLSEKKTVQNQGKVASEISPECLTEDIDGHKLKSCSSGNKRKFTDFIENSNKTPSSKKSKNVENRSEKIAKKPEDCPESKTVLQKARSMANESRMKISKDEKKFKMPHGKVKELNIDVENEKEDKIYNKWQENKTELLETGESCESKQNDKSKAFMLNNDVNESFGNQNSSVVNNATEESLRKLRGSTGKKYDPVHTNSNKELGMDSCKTSDKKDEHRGETTQLNDNCKDDDRKNKSKDAEKTIKRKPGPYNDTIEDNRRKRRNISSSSSSDSEDSNERERSNRRRSERHIETSEYSYDHERRKERYRKYSSRDDCNYDRKYREEEKRRHRKYYDGNGHEKPRIYVRDIEQERKIDFRLGRSTIRDSAKLERRVIYVGGLPYGTTRDELWKRFRKFGPIEKVTVHLRVGERDNYGFVTFFEPEDARDCIELGNSDPSEPYFDLCFGGRRQFCGGSYVDFDSTNSHIEELNETYGKVCEEPPEEDDFDSLLRMCQEGLGR